MRYERWEAMAISGRFHVWLVGEGRRMRGFRPLGRLRTFFTHDEPMSAVQSLNFMVQFF
jgi:hypothetical protein